MTDGTNGHAGEDDLEREAAPFSDVEEEDSADSTNATGQVRIAAVEAAVAAGLAPSARRAPDVTEPVDAEDDLTVVELPAWTSPPTGQVPRVLLDEGAEDELGASPRGPSWRQSSEDWDDDLDLSIFADDAEPVLGAEIAGHAEDTGEHPYAFGDLGLSGSDDPLTDDEAWASVLGETPPVPSDTYGLESFGPVHLDQFGRRRKKGAHRAAPRNATPSEPDPSGEPTVALHAAPSGEKKPVLRAWATGIVLAGVAAACFALGSWPVLVLAAAVLVVAGGEVFAALRRVGFEPASPPGLLAIGALPVATYFHGASGAMFVVALGVIATGAFYLFGFGGVRPVANLSVTLGVFAWIGLLGAFAGLLLSPSAYPHRHGVAILLGAIICTVAHDLGSYLVGSRLGRHHLAPAVSPNKTIEGLIGGTASAIIAGGAVCSQIHPMGLAFGIELAVLVSIFAPIGDLVESLIKRDLGTKDLGNALPGHGGMIDRIDAMLFVLPAAYYLASVHHLG